jgi:large subunit ribosomal protein L28
MAAVCDICGKGPGIGKSVSHSHRRSRRRWDPHFQTVHVARPGGK